MFLKSIVTLALSTSLLVSLGGCGTKQGHAEAAVKDLLKDPDSAQFSDFIFNDKTGQGCITVSAKNSFGGYGESEQMMVFEKDGVWEAQDPGILAAGLCNVVRTEVVETE